MEPFGNGEELWNYMKSIGCDISFSVLTTIQMHIFEVHELVGVNRITFIPDTMSFIRSDGW